MVLGRSDDLLEVLVVPLAVLRFAADAGVRLLLCGGRERAVGRPAPGRVQLPVEQADLEGPDGVRRVRPDGKRCRPRHPRPAARHGRPALPRWPPPDRRWGSSPARAPSSLPGSRPNSNRCSPGILGVRRGRPPGHHLGLRPGQPDVQQPQRLTGLLGRRPALPIDPTVGRLPADVEHAAAVVVVQQQHVRLGDPSVERERQVDDRELQSLAGVQGDHLDGGGVAVQPADAVGCQVDGGFVPAAPQPFDQRRQSETVGGGDGLQPLPDVPQIGQSPGAALLGEQPGGQVLLDDRHLEQRRHPALGEQPGPGPQGGAEPVGERALAAGAEFGGGQTEERGERRGPHPSRSGAAVPAPPAGSASRHPPGWRRRCRHRRSPTDTLALSRASRTSAL